MANKQNAKKRLSKADRDTLAQGEQISAGRAQVGGTRTRTQPRRATNHQEDVVFNAAPPIRPKAVRPKTKPQEHLAPKASFQATTANANMVTSAILSEPRNLPRIQSVDKPFGCFDSIGDLLYEAFGGDEMDDPLTELEDELEDPVPSRGSGRRPARSQLALVNKSKSKILWGPSKHCSHDLKRVLWTQMMKPLMNHTRWFTKCLLQMAVVSNM
jgi:hypothetical protein